MVASTSLCVCSKTHVPFISFCHIYICEAVALRRLDGRNKLRPSRSLRADATRCILFRFLQADATSASLPFYLDGCDEVRPIPFYSGGRDKRVPPVSFTDATRCVLPCTDSPCSMTDYTCSVQEPLVHFGASMVSPAVSPLISQLG